MRKAGIFIFAVVLFFACGGNKSGSSESGGQTSSAVNDSTTEVVIIPVEELLKNPDRYVDKEIKVEGMVTHVCKHSGQRLHLSDEQGTGNIRVEAGDKIKRFERDLEGSEIVAQGILRRQVIDEAHIEEMAKNGRGGNGMHMEDEGEEGKAGTGEEADAQERANNMRKMLQESGEDRIVTYWLDGESFEEKN
jgi:hypothetical protein